MIDFIPMAKVENDKYVIEFKQTIDSRVAHEHGFFMVSVTNKGNCVTIPTYYDSFDCPEVGMLCFNFALEHFRDTCKFFGMLPYQTNEKRPA